MIEQQHSEIAVVRNELDFLRRQHADEMAKMQKALAVARASNLQKDAALGDLERCLNDVRREKEGLCQRQASLAGVVGMLESLSFDTGAAASAELTAAYPKVREVERRLEQAERQARDEMMEVLRDGITCCVCLDHPKVSE